MEITVHELAELLNCDPRPKLVDVREPGEYEIVRLEGGALLTQELMNEILEDWDKETEIVCYCHHGIRSLQATGFLRHHGFKNVRSMRGGIDLYAQEIDLALPRY